MPKKYLVISGLLILCALFGALWFAFPPQKVTGVEVSNDVVQHRSFYRRRWLGFTIHEETKRWETPLETYIKKQGWVREQKTDNPQWHLSKEMVEYRGLMISLQSRHLGFIKGRARQLCSLLRCYSGQSDRWVTWSKQHPERAAEVWPEFYRLLREDSWSEANDFLRRAEYPIF